MYRSTTSGVRSLFGGPPAGRGGLYVRSCRAVVPREQYAKGEYQDGQMPRLAAVRRSTRFRVRKQVAALHSAGQCGPGYIAARLSRLRSRSDNPPQMPKRSSCSRAYSRHSARTSQLRQTFFASRVEPPFSGKNASGSVCAHSARSSQLSSPASSTSMSKPSCTSETMTSDTAHLQPPPDNPVGPCHSPWARELHT